MKDYIFFDLDGTLTDSEPGIIDSLNVMTTHFGITRTREELRPFLGPALWDSCPKYLGFNKEQTEEAVRVYREHYFSTGIYNNKLYDGVLSLLKTLKESGRHLIVATGKPEEQANIVCNYFDIAKYFDFIAGSTLDVSRSKKGQVIEYALKNCNLTENDKNRIIMVGDRDNDINGAHQNGIKVVSVLYGYGNREEFAQAGTDYVCETVEDLQELLLHKSL